VAGLPFFSRGALAGLESPEVMVLMSIQVCYTGEPAEGADLPRHSESETPAVMGVTTGLEEEAVRLP
jgi:hypothetical protein